MIPKIIHQVWIGDKKRPSEIMNDWCYKHQDWIYVFWNERTIAGMYPKGLRNQRHFDEHQSLCGKVDILRYEILYDFGGIYIDADSVCINKLDDCLLQKDFACYENEEVMPGLVAAGYLGFEKHSINALKMIEVMQSRESLTKEKTGLESWQSVGPQLFTEVINKYKLDMVIYPSYYFIPQHHSGKKYEGPGKSYAHQLWGSTFNLYKQ